MKHFVCIFTFWKQLEHQNLGFTVFKATLNCMQNTRMQYLMISFISDKNLKHISELESVVGFENLFFTILLGHVLCMEYPFGH